MKEYHWPGNVRELRNMIENLVIRSRGKPVTAELLRPILGPLRMIGVGDGTDTTLESPEIPEFVRRLKKRTATNHAPLRLLASRVENFIHA